MSEVIVDGTDDVDASPELNDGEYLELVKYLLWKVIGKHCTPRAINNKKIKWLECGHSKEPHTLLKKPTAGSAQRRNKCENTIRINNYYHAHRRLKWRVITTFRHSRNKKNFKHIKSSNLHKFTTSFEKNKFRIIQNWPCDGRRTW